MTSIFILLQTLTALRLERSIVVLFNQNMSHSNTEEEVLLVHKRQELDSRF